MISSKAIIIGRRNWGEADRIVTLYTEKWGRIEAQAKGVRKPKAKLRSCLEPFNHLEVSLVKAKARPIIIDAVLIGAFPRLRQNLAGITAAFAVSELLEKGIPESGADGFLWKAVLDSFEFLDEVRPENKNILPVGFIALRILDFLGLRPEFYRCVVCGKNPKEDLFFSPSGGGVVHRSCAFSPDFFPVPVNLVKLARVFLAQNLDFIVKLKIGENDKNELVRFLQTFFNYHLRENLESLRFL